MLAFFLLTLALLAFCVSGIINPDPAGRLLALALACWALAQLTTRPTPR